MPVSRNTLAKNSNTHHRNARLIPQKMTALNNICTKHKIGNLTFKSCKFVSADGKVTFIDFDNIKGNMKSGIMLVKTTVITPSSDAIYDLVKIDSDKKATDEKKHQEELEQSKSEIERLNSSNIEGSDEHKNLLAKLTEEVAEAKKASELIEILDNESMTNSNETSTGISENESIANSNETSTGILDDESIANSKKDKSAKAKRERALKQMKEQMKQKADKPIGNKYYRNFMKDLKNKFSLEPQQYKFLEVRAETTDMVIDNVVIYKIVMPPNTKEIYFLAIGDLQMKSGLVRQIDPNYKSENFFKENADFLERIQAKENAKITEASADTIDEELDDLDEIRMSDDDEPIPELVPSESIQTEK